MLLLISLFVFLSVVLVTWELLRPKADPVRRRIARTGSGTSDAAGQERVRGSLTHRVLAPAIARAGRALSMLLPQTWIRKINHMLIVANEPWSLFAFLGAWALSTAMGVALVLYLVTALPHATGMQTVLMGLVVMASATLLPYARLRGMANRRRKAISRALPDAIDLLTTSVEAGLGVDAAFALVAEKTRGPLADSFALYLRQVGLGRGRQDALTYVAERTDVPDLVGIAYNVNQGEELGTPLGDVLRAQASDLRVLRRQRAEMAAQRAPVLMTIPMALCFMPAMGAVVIVPSILNLFKFLGGLGH